MAKEMNKNQDGNNTYKFFNIITILLLLYMAYSMYNTYTQLSAYCENYDTTMIAQWSYCLQAFLAAIVPCLIYACTSYGLGIIIKNQQALLKNK